MDNSTICVKNQYVEPIEEKSDSLKLIPSVIGMGLKDALLVLEQEGIKVRVKGHGCVKEQIPESGNKFNKGDVVTITLK